MDGTSFDRWVRNLGIAQARTPFRSPRVNAIAVADGLVDRLRAFGKGLGSTRQHVGDGAFGIGQSRAAYHRAAVQIGDERDDSRPKRGTGRHIGGGLSRDGLPTAGTITAVQVGPRSDRLDWGQLYMVVSVCEHLTLGRYLPTAGAALGKDVE
jgi:hypothetical protein